MPNTDIFLLKITQVNYEKIMFRYDWTIKIPWKGVDKNGKQ